jgi:hypothetical protein
MIHRRTYVLVALALLAACAGNPWTVDRFEAPEADVASKKTFLYTPGEVAAQLARQPEIATRTEAQVRAVIVGELQRKGYVEVSGAAGADMVVTYQASGMRRFVESDQRRIGAPSPNQVLTPGSMPRRPASELPPELSVREVSLVVFVEDPATSKLVWRGLVNAELRIDSLEGVVRQVTDMARDIMKQFPARRAKDKK